MNNMLHAQTMLAKRRRITVPPAVRMTEIRPPSCAPCTDYVFFCAACGRLFFIATDQQRDVVQMRCRRRLFLWFFRHDGRM